MPREQIEARIDGPGSLSAGPYRLHPPIDPRGLALINDALSAAHRDVRRLKRVERWMVRLGAGGFIAAALIAIPPRGDDSGGPQAVIWVPMAAGATYALVRAGRTESRMRDIEAEIAGLERLSEALARTPGR